MRLYDLFAFAVVVAAIGAMNQLATLVGQIMGAPL